MKLNSGEKLHKHVRWKKKNANRFMLINKSELHYKERYVLASRKRKVSKKSLQFHQVYIAASSRCPHVEYAFTLQ